MNKKHLLTTLTWLVFISGIGVLVILEKFFFQLNYIEILVFILFSVSLFCYLRLERKFKYRKQIIHEVADEIEEKALSRLSPEEQNSDYLLGRIVDCKNKFINKMEKKLETERIFKKRKNKKN